LAGDESEEGGSVVVVHPAVEERVDTGRAERKNAAQHVAQLEEPTEHQVVSASKQVNERAGCTEKNNKLITVADYSLTTQNEDEVVSELAHEVKRDHRCPIPMMTR